MNTLTSLVKPVLSCVSGNSQSRTNNELKKKKTTKLSNFGKIQLIVPKSKPSKLYFLNVSIVLLINFFLLNNLIINLENSN